MTSGTIKVHIGCSDTYTTCDLATQKCDGGDASLAMVINKQNVTFTYAGSKVVIGKDDFSTTAPKDLYILPRPGQDGARLFASESGVTCQDMADSIYPNFSIKELELEPTNSEKNITITINFKKLNSNGVGYSDERPETIIYNGTYTLVQQGSEYILKLDVTQPDGSFFAKYPKEIKTSVTLDEPVLTKDALKFFAKYPYEGSGQKIFYYDPTVMLAAPSGGGLGEPDLTTAENKQFFTYLAAAYSKSEAFIKTAIGKMTAQGEGKTELDALKVMAFKPLKKMLEEKIATTGVDFSATQTTYDELAIAFGLDPKTATPQQIEEKIKALAVAKPVDLSTIDKSVFIDFLTDAYKKPEVIIATAVGKIRALDDKTSEIDALKILTFKYLKKLIDTKGTQPQSSATTYDSLAVAFKLDPKTATPQQIEEKIKALAVVIPLEPSAIDKSVFIGFLTDAYKKPEAFITTAVGKIRAFDDKTSEIDALKILTFKYLKKLLDTKISEGATFTATPPTYDELASAFGLKPDTAKPQDIQAEIEKLQPVAR